MKKWIINYSFMVGCFLLFFNCPVYGSETEDILEETEISFDEIDKMLDASSLKSQFSFEKLIRELVGGNMENAFQMVVEVIKKNLLNELTANQKNIVQIILLAIFAALFTNIASGFVSSSLQETGFFAVYLTMTGIVLNSFFLMLSITNETLTQVFSFMEVLLPAYVIAVTMVSGSASSLGLYEMTFLLMRGCQWALKTILIPLIEIYMVVGIVNYLGETERFSYMGDLVKKGTEQLLKWSLGMVVGINLIQNMILPAVDSVKSGIWQKGLAAIPGAGPVISVVTGSLLGSSVLIKNSIGAGGLIFLILLCAVPIIKLLILMMSFYLCAAFLQPISDKRLMNLLYTAGEGGKLLLQILITCFALFFITIALAAVSTNMRYYGA